MPKQITIILCNFTIPRSISTKNLRENWLSYGIPLFALLSTDDRNSSDTISKTENRSALEMRILFDTINAPFEERMNETRDIVS